MWGVGNYVLTPPSVRPEGVYVATGENVYEVPDWLAETIAAHGRTYADHARRSLDRADTAAEPVARWGAAVPWAAILEPAEWMPVGKADGCGCPMWTAPGVHGNPKSATAHEAGCARWVDAPDPPLHVWTDNPGDPWAARIAATGKPTFSKLQAVALLHYDGKEGAAMDALGIDLTDGDAMVPPGEELPATSGAPPHGTTPGRTAPTTGPRNCPRRSGPRTPSWSTSARSRTTASTPPMPSSVPRCRGCRRTWTRASASTPG